MHRRAAIARAYHREVPDQLNLSLTGDVARLPRTLRPMLPRSAEAPFDSSDHVFEPNWGGRRVLAFIEPGRAGKPSLRLLDAAGQDLAPRLPELAYIVDLVGEPPAILDGELVVPDRSGRMDEDALAARLADGQTAGSSPVYLVFDLLWAGGRPLIAQPLLKRRERLAKVVTPSPELVVVPGVVSDGLELHFAVAQQGLAGLRRDPAQPGQVPLHLVPDPIAAPTRPVLALIQRLPFDD